jgi:hypothetical protein
MFIREFVEKPNICIVRAQTYAHSFAHIAGMVQAAKEDFPALKDDDIQVVFYGGDHYRGTMGIEFTPAGDVPATYQVISQVELTLT